MHQGKAPILIDKGLKQVNDDTQVSMIRRFRLDAGALLN